MARLTVIDRSKKLPAFFYQTSGGNEPVHALLPQSRRKALGGP